MSHPPPSTGLTAADADRGLSGDRSLVAPGWTAGPRDPWPGPRHRWDQFDYRTRV